MFTDYNRYLVILHIYHELIKHWKMAMKSSLAIFDYALTPPCDYRSES